VAAETVRRSPGSAAPFDRIRALASREDGNARPWLFLHTVNIHSIGAAFKSSVRERVSTLQCPGPALCTHYAAALARARHAPTRTISPGTMIAAQMIFSRFCLTQGILPNR
jgi:hypothetical protein